MSFLQAASAKIITNKILNKQVDTDSFGGGRDIHTLTETLRLLLVEEECEAINNCDGKDNNCNGVPDGEQPFGNVREPRIHPLQDVARRGVQPA